MNHLRLAALVLTLGSFVGTGCVADDGDSSLLIINDSDFVIEDIRVTPAGSSSWGPNLLGGDVLFPDEQFEIEVECDLYDAQLIDEDGVECTVFDLDLCFTDADWVIRNNTCDVFGAAKAAREAAAKASSTAAPKAGSNATPASN
jgi:hypothetical protein